MKKGLELLIVENKYTLSIIEDFEKVLGVLPNEYKYFLTNYKSGYPSIEKIEDTDVYVKANVTGESFIIESFLTLPDTMDHLYGFDRAFGLSGNHRKYRLLPICTSGSSHRFYFMKIDTGEIFYLNPNGDLDKELDLERYRLANDVLEFIGMFVNEV